MTIFSFKVTFTKRILHYEEDIIHTIVESKYSDIKISKKIPSDVWKSNRKEKIKSIYSDKMVIAFREIPSLKYFLIDNSIEKSSDHVTYDVLVMGQSKIDDDYKRTVNDIKKIVSKFKLKYNDNISFFLYSVYNEDIIDPNFSLKLRKRSNYNHFDKIKLVIYFTIIFAITVMFIFNWTKIIGGNEVALSIFVSIVLTSSSDFLPKLTKHQFGIEPLEDGINKTDDYLSPAQKFEKPKED